MNKKAMDFRSRNTKQAALQANANLEILQRLQQMIYGMSYKLFQLEQEFNSTKAQARVADYRSLATANLLKTGGTFSERQLIEAIFELQAKDFEEQSARDDQEKNLEVVTDQAASNDQHAITTVRLFKDGKEIEDQRIVRSKVVLGRNELFAGFDEQVLGMTLGETKRFKTDKFPHFDEAEVTLLGLRKARPQPEPSATPDSVATPATPGDGQTSA
jgi:hypothetical protein